MGTAPFGQTVMLWRQEGGLTQQTLARRAGIPQPNLSAIERGRRTVSLSTIRALAAALGVRPGILVDGVPPTPGAGGRPSLSREAIERIADAVACHRRLTEPGEQATVEALRALLGHRMRAARRQWGRPRTGRRGALAAWIRLKSLYGQSAIQTLADRVLERQGAHDPPSD
jgi:transcriptional regulator with XRE-family HTH domain